jgi:cyclic pyranopterin phosphate synthase
VNVSLDTVDPEVFRTLTRRDRLADVVAGLAAAADAGLAPVKVNAVLMRGVNDTEAPALLRWCLERGYELRIIEQMPLDAQHGWRRDDMVTADEIWRRCAREFDLVPVAADVRGSAPAETWLVDGGPGDRRRDRLGDEAVLRCLRPGAPHRRRPAAQLPVRPRRGRPARPAALGRRRRGLAERMRSVLWGKRAGHGIDDPTFLQPGPPDVGDRRLS